MILATLFISWVAWRMLKAGISLVWDIVFWTGALVAVFMGSYALWTVGL